MKPAVFSGAKLREFRLKAGLSQEQLAELSDTSLSNISRAESGVHKSPQINHVIQWAVALKVDIKKLME